MDVIGMGLVTTSEISKVMSPSINKAKRRTTERRKILSDRDANTLLQTKALEQALKLEPIRLNMPQPFPLAIES